MNQEEFVTYLRDLVMSKSSMLELSRKTGQSRGSLYKSLDSGSDPHLSTILTILDALGMRLEVREK